jgi:hypothetical protein
MKKHNKIISMWLSRNPEIQTRAVMFFDKQKDIKNKNKKQFITTKDCFLFITFDNGTTLHLHAPKHYKFDGATIPFGIGKGDMRLLIPALFHDILCENKAIVNYDRYLADTIFKECLILCGVPKTKAHIMFLIVEAYQKTFCSWRDKDEN